MHVTLINSQVGLCNCYGYGNRDSVICGNVVTAYSYHTVILKKWVITIPRINPLKNMCVIAWMLKVDV